MLGAEADLVVEQLTFEGRVAAASSGSKYRTQTLAAALAQWTSCWLCRLQALHAVEWGNYVSAMPLVRAASDHHAAMLYVLSDGAAEWQDWLRAGGIARSNDFQADEFVLHPFRAAEVLAADPVLGPIYRTATDLSLSHFGARLLLTAADSSPGKVAVTFGDRDFHLGLAEIVLGWLLAMGSAMASTLEANADVFASADEQESTRLREAAARALGRNDRCGIETRETPEGMRYLVSGWRRVPGGAPRRIVL